VNALQQTAAEVFAGWAVDVRPDKLPDPVRRALQRQLLDSAGLMVAARNADYVQATVAASDGTGQCTAIGHAGGFDVAAAALINGTAIHGEDFDDTFEGTPVHIGSVMVPALLAAAEQRGLSGASVLTGLAAGSELICRMALVAPTAMHRQGFHPTAVCGAFGAAAGVAVAIGLPPAQIASALGIVGSMASGIIEYLAEGTWTKRMHPGWAAQSGWRAARMAESGFLGPPSVFEGTHGAFKAFAVPKITPDFAHLREGWGVRWELANLAFKPYACGTMAQPFIDCALQLRGRIPDVEAIRRIDARVGEGTVHRLWEPKAEKARPSSPYSAKFSVPFCVAVSLIDGGAGLSQFTQERIADAQVTGVAEKIHYEIDPDDEYPANYTGHLTVTLNDGSRIAADQPCLRGGRRDPLDDQEIERKFAANVAFGGWNHARSGELAEYCSGLFEYPDLTGLRAFAG
jgi:2-methylcitrate dehydratase PrpD